MWNKLHILRAVVYTSNDNAHKVINAHFHYKLSYSRAFLPYKVRGNFPTSLSTCPASPLVTANAPPVFLPFSITRPMPLSHFRVGPRTHISSMGYFVSWSGDECVIAFPMMSLLIDIKIPDGRGVWIPECPLRPHDRALWVWCPHQSQYL